MNSGAEPWHLHHVEMTIELDHDRVTVDATAHVTRGHGERSTVLTLDGRDLTLHALVVDGEPLDVEQVERDDRSLRVPVDAGDEHVVAFRVSSVPGPPSGQGFTRRPTLLSTNCEPTGFRRITYFLDRPSNRATYDVTLIGDARRYPTMLCNGDLVGHGELADGRQWCRYVDPIPKPSYLFAVVAGALDAVSRPHVTAAGRALTLTVAAPREQIDGADFALATMAQMLAFDEANGAIEHDLDTLTFVSIPGYPDATEYHGLMFFESGLLMVDTRGFVDDNLLAIVANVAHEYGHHVRGNRVTVRTWGELALKEGLTVLTAQNDFRAHLFGPAARILDVADLRRLQFPEEITIGAPVLQGEVADPNRLYTRTTYLKSAEIFRMLRSVLGPTVWRDVFDEFVRRYDLGAATVDDFIAVAGEQSPRHRNTIDAIARWFHLAGRPAVDVSSSLVAGTDACEVEVVVRRTDSLADHPQVAIPIVFGFHTASGAPLTVDLDGRTSATHLIVVDARERRFRARTIEPNNGTESGGVIVSALRGYSAPVDLHSDLSSASLAALVMNDDDPFTRWWASDELMTRVIDSHRRGVPDVDDTHAALVAALGHVIRNEADPLLLSQLLTPPDEYTLGDRDWYIDVDGVAAGLAELRRLIGDALHDDLLALHASGATEDPDGIAPRDIASRMLVEPVLGYLLATASAAGVAAAVADLASPNATRATRALAQLAHIDALPLDDYLAVTSQRWAAAPKLIDRWVRAQTGARRRDTIERVRSLVDSGSYNRHDRGRVAAVWWPFCTRNRAAFHDYSGAGYHCFVDEAAMLLTIDPSLVLRYAGDLLQFERFDPHRRALMRAELDRLAGMPGIPGFAVELLESLLGAAPATDDAGVVPSDGQIPTA